MGRPPNSILIPIKIPVVYPFAKPFGTRETKSTGFYITKWHGLSRQPENLQMAKRSTNNLLTSHQCVRLLWCIASYLLVLSTKLVLRNTKPIVSAWEQSSAGLLSPLAMLAKWWEIIPFPLLKFESKVRGRSSERSEVFASHYLTCLIINLRCCQNTSIMEL